MSESIPYVARGRAGRCEGGRKLNYKEIEAALALLWHMEPRKEGEVRCFLREVCSVWREAMASARLSSACPPSTTDPRACELSRRYQ